MARWSLFVLLALSACAPPDQVGQRVGQSLYNASVNTGRALSEAGDRTGQVLQTAGANLRGAVTPPPPVYALPPELPPPYVPNGYAPPAPVTSEPLGPGPSGYDPYRDGPRDAPNPVVGY